MEQAPYKMTTSPPLEVALRYFAMRWLKGKRDVVAPTSAPMLHTVAMPVEEEEGGEVVREREGQEGGRKGGRKRGRYIYRERGRKRERGGGRGRRKERGKEGEEAKEGGERGKGRRGEAVDRPVQEMDSVPGPKYSMMEPVPPETVRMSATVKMTSVEKEERAFHNHTPGNTQ